MLGYVYLHRKKTDNSVFYVGLGGFAKSEKPDSYSRAYKLTQRNKHHRNIVEKYGCNIEIFKDKLDLNEAKSLESELINKYNLYKYGANQTLGGDGTFGYKHSDLTKKKVSESTNARFKNLKWKSKWLKSLKNKDQEKIIKKTLDSRKIKPFFVYEAILINQKGVGSGIRNYKTGKFIGTWRNKAKCCRDLNIPHAPSKIRGCLAGQRNVAYGFIFKHEEIHG